MPDPTPTPPHRLTRTRRVARAVARFALRGVIVLFAAWSVLAVRFADLSGRPPRNLTAALVGLAILGCLLFVRPRKYRWPAACAIIAVVLAWYFSIEPRNDRVWRPDVARIPTVEVDGDRLIVHNVRHCDWRSDEDFTVHWSDETYALSELQSVDMLFCHWGSNAIAHAMVSFGFGADRYLCASIETRIEAAETQDSLQSFFRQYELVYVFADERDIVRVRTNVRHQDVYLYRVALTGLEARALLISYAQRANALAAHPEFYNAATSNCVTNVVHMSRIVNPHASVSWEILFSGYAPRKAYRNGRLDGRLPFEQLEARSLIDDAAKAANDDPHFSQAIRAGLPVPPPTKGTATSSSPPTP